MRKIILLQFFFVIGAGAASAQTTNCRWVGSDWVCDTRERRGIDPNAGSNAYDRAFNIMTKPSEDYIAARRIRQQQKMQEEQIQIQRNTFLEQQRVENMEQNRQLQAEKHNQEQILLRQQTGKLVAAGDCPAAMTAAVSAGDFVLASQIKQYCQK